jgi:hypothetical protein
MSRQSYFSCLNSTKFKRSWCTADVVTVPCEEQKLWTWQIVSSAAVTGTACMTRLQYCSNKTYPCINFSSSSFLMFLPFLNFKAGTVDRKLFCSSHLSLIGSAVTCICTGVKLWFLCKETPRVSWNSDNIVLCLIQLQFWTRRDRIRSFIVKNQI